MVAQSPEPGAHALNVRAFRTKLEFRSVGFCGEGKTGVPGEKPLGAEKRTNNKLNPHMTSSPGIEPGPHWWKASALTTAPSLLLCKVPYQPLQFWDIFFFYSKHCNTWQRNTRTLVFCNFINPRGRTTQNPRGGTTTYVFFLKLTTTTT